MVHLVDFTIEIYYDARPYERQKSIFSVANFTRNWPTRSR